MVAVVLLLQARGRMTVPELAAQLESSERTIRRDLESLSMAGVPVYSLRGRGGGWQLLGGHRIDLTGLTVDEAQSLLLATGPGAEALGPGIGRGLAAARRKVVAALPDALRLQAEAATATILVDPSRWGGSDGGRLPRGSEDGHVLDTLRAAVTAGRQVDGDYEPPGRPVEARRLHPHGLVCKRGVWYLLATSPSGLRTYRVSRMRSVSVTDDPVDRPADFDLARAWAEVQRDVAGRVLSPTVVHADVALVAMRRLRATIGSWWPVEEGAASGDSVSVTIRFASAASAAAELAGFGPLVTVRAPEDVRAELAAMGAGLVASYGAPVAGP